MLFRLLGAGVGAGVGEIERDEERDRAAEAFLREAPRTGRHLFEIGRGGGRDERHEVVHGEEPIGQGPGS